MATLTILASIFSIVSIIYNAILARKVKWQDHRIGELVRGSIVETTREILSEEPNPEDNGDPFEEIAAMNTQLTTYVDNKFAEFRKEEALQDEKLKATIESLGRVKDDIREWRAQSVKDTTNLTTRLNALELSSDAGVQDKRFKDMRDAIDKVTADMASLNADHLKEREEFNERKRMLNEKLAKVEESVKAINAWRNVC